ncbi:MAG TPA: hypothetical protein VF755_11250 [Catenuloplanes sp.]|jgi:hypothetical protein
MENEDVAQLSVIAEARAALADRLTTPWWYHPALGLLITGHVLSIGLGGTTVKTAGGVLFIAGCCALVSIYRRLTGVWVSGFDAGRASRWATAMGALVGTVLAGAWALDYFTELTWPIWYLAAVAFVGAVVLGRRFDTALRAQLRAGA